MGRPCPPTTQGDFRQTRAFSLRLPARSCRRGAPAATSTAAKHTPHRPHTHGIGRLREGCDVSDCLPMHSARGYGEYGPCVSYCDCPNRLSKVGSPRASFELLAEPRHFGEAGGPALHLRTCTHTDSSADTPSTDIRTMYSSSKVSRAAPRWISISPARRRSRRRDRRES